MRLNNIVELLLCMPLLVILVLSIVPMDRIKEVSLYASFIILLVSICVWIIYDNKVVGFQLVSEHDIFRSINVSYYIGIDGLALLMILLTTLIIPLCILCSWTAIKYRVREFYITLFVIELLLLQVFTVLDLILFYLFFESVLIPMFFLIGVWGSRLRRIHAVYQFFLYTLLGSLFMLLGILLLYFETGSTNIQVLLNSELSFEREILIWASLFVSFAVKVPVVPVHIWLPEAHVEAPTAGSVLLAGVLLKMGTYALLRFSLPIMPEATEYFVPLVYMISIISILYSSCSTIRQIDIKKVIAYSSVAHMNFVTLGLMSNNIQGLEGSIFLMVGHGLVSSALFICIGVLYERYHTRIINYYGGLIFGMPLFGVIFMLFTLGNVSLPGTSNFIGEMLIMLGTTMRSPLVAMLGGVGIILGAIYAFWLYNRVMFGNVKVAHITNYCDMNRREFYTMLPLLFLMMFVGILPNNFSGILSGPLFAILERNI
jgi:NADH-quinone oxidoreductase subunit M